MMSYQHIGEGPFLHDRETTLGHTHSYTNGCARLSPMQHSELLRQGVDPALSPLHSGGLPLHDDCSAVPFSALAGANKTLPHTWSIDLIDFEEVSIDPVFDEYLGGIGDAHLALINDDDDKLGDHKKYSLLLIRILNSILIENCSLF